jgi:hypothetical protein
MSKELFSSTEIDAPAEQVWAILTDFAEFKSWNPFIVDAQGQAEVGSQLTLRMQPVGGSAMTLRPTVVEVIDGQVLRWLGRFWVPGLFDADHSFVVKPLGASRTAWFSASSSVVCWCPSSGGHWIAGRCRRPKR